jgi:23S rRNA (uridine2552-2'-O)-methyltransferase
MLRAGQRVVDLGAWPGGWMQVAAGIVGSGGRVVGIDVAEIEPFPELANVIALQGDLSEAGVEARLLDALGGPADVVLSDAAPKLTGIRPTDRAREEALLEAVEALVARLLRPGGTLVLKLLEGPEAQAAARRLARRFATAKVTKLQSTRPGSAEKYLVTREFCG